MGDQPPPYKVSGAYHAQVAQHATWADADGWRIAETFGAPNDEAARIFGGVGLQDVSPVGKLDLKGTAVDGRLADCERLDGVGAVLRIKPGHALVVTERRDDRVREAVRGLYAPSQGCAHITDVTSAFAAFMLVGPRAPDVLASVTSIDLRPQRFGDGSAAPCTVAHVQGVLYRRDWGELRAYLVLVGRDAAEYVWTTMHHAGEHFGLIPFGVAAQRIIWESQAAVALRAPVSVTAG